MGLRILIIEDNADNLEVIACLLEGFGHTPLSARDGVEGLETAIRERPDMIVCDLQLPGINGFDLCRQLKQDALLRAIPLVAVTAQAMAGDKQKVLEAGFNGYISKPIDPRNFVEQLKSYLAASTGR